MSERFAVVLTEEERDWIVAALEDARESGERRGWANVERLDRLVLRLELMEMGGAV